MPLILSGKVAREELKKPLIEKIKALKEKRGDFALAIIQVGDRPDSAAYINAKKRFGAEIGVLVRLVHFKEDAPQGELLSQVKKLNQDKEVAGIIVQLPLPKGLDERTVLDIIEPKKDADAITSARIARWMTVGKGGIVVGPEPMWPATARGLYELVEFYKIPIKAKRACVIGRSRFVGKPIADILQHAGAIVTVCHSKTPDLMKETRAADVIISAVGKAGLITAEHVKAGQIVVDVGLSRVNLDDREKLVGDVDFEKAKAVLGEKGAITPVPGGVGPMTVLALFENLADRAMM